VLQVENADELVHDERAVAALQEALAEEEDVDPTSVMVTLNCVACPPSHDNGTNGTNELVGKTYKDGFYRNTNLKMKLKESGVNFTNATGSHELYPNETELRKENEELSALAKSQGQHDAALLDDGGGVGMKISRVAMVADSRAAASTRNITSISAPDAETGVVDVVYTVFLPPGRDANASRDHLLNDPAEVLQETITKDLLKNNVGEAANVHIVFRTGELESGDVARAKLKINLTGKVDATKAAQAFCDHRAALVATADYAACQEVNSTQGLCNCAKAYGDALVSAKCHKVIQFEKKLKNGLVESKCTWSPPGSPVQCGECTGGCIVSDACHFLDPWNASVNASTCEEYNGTFCKAEDNGAAGSHPHGVLQVLLLAFVSMMSST